MTIPDSRLNRAAPQYCFKPDYSNKSKFVDWFSRDFYLNINFVKHAIGTVPTVPTY